MYRIISFFFFILHCCTPIYAQGTENALRGFFEMLFMEASLFILGLILLFFHFRKSSNRNITSILLLVYSIPILSYLLKRYLEVYDQYNDALYFWFKMMLPIILITLIALIASIVHYIKKSELKNTEKIVKSI